MTDFWFSSQAMVASQYSTLFTNPDAIMTESRQLV